MGETFVGVDRGASASTSLRWAVSRAAALRERVVLVHAAEHAADAVRGERILAEAEEAARQQSADVRCETRLLEGSVMRALVALGRPGDLLVIGTRRTGFLRGRLIGSRGVLVAIASRRSVAVLPEHDRQGRRGVLAGIPPTGDPSVAVRAAAREAQRLGEPLTLLLASPPADGASEAGSADALARARAVATDAGAPPSIAARAVRRPVAEALLDAGRSASLVVLGDSGRGPVAGPVVHDVLINITAPVLIARADR
ncbi:universal stress protein [Agrococcus carbonis]|uniref:universal stress protein n=1 Tax=Agrococcus carbonis TaxID=684552 RepID=UPI000B8152C4|nr:universal stress protein [Agrococcus carbonis]